MTETDRSWKHNSQIEREAVTAVQLIQSLLCIVCTGQNNRRYTHQYTLLKRKLHKIQTTQYTASQKSKPIIFSNQTVSEGA